MNKPSRVREFAGYLRRERKLWLVPLIVVVLVVCAVVILTGGGPGAGTSSSAPFDYPQF
jgi:hypothetical protein